MKKGKERIAEDRNFAIKTHKDQMYGDKPYVYHLDAAAEVLREFGFTEEENTDLFSAIYFHDLMEDQGVTHQALFMEGAEPQVIEMVWAVSDEEGRSRAERKLKTYGKIANTEDAVIIKLADRIANTEEGGKLDMYQKEHKEFKRALFNAKTSRRQIVSVMWLRLDRIISGQHGQQLSDKGKQN